MSYLAPFLTEVSLARRRYLDTVVPLTEAQAQWKPSAERWNAVELTEHLYWAEHGAIWGMWRALHAQQAGRPVWSGDLVHRGLPIETIVARTWQPQEQAPAIAAPRMGGPLPFWTAALASLHAPLQGLAEALAGADPEAVIHPHPISGPLDIRQRFEFLRFHLDRHRQQLLALGMG